MPSSQTHSPGLPPVSNMDSRYWRTPDPITVERPAPFPSAREQVLLYHGCMTAARRLVSSPNFRDLALSTFNRHRRIQRIILKTLKPLP